MLRSKTTSHDTDTKPKKGPTQSHGAALRFSVSQEVAHYFVHTRREYLLNMLVYLQHGPRPDGVGADRALFDPVKAAHDLGVSKQTANNHVEKLKSLGFVKPVRGRRSGLLHIYGSKHYIERVRAIRGVSKASLGFKETRDTDKRFLARLDSNYAAVFKFCHNVIYGGRQHFRATIQGAFFARNIRQQAFQAQRKKPQSTRVSNNGDANTGGGPSGMVGVELAGGLIGRSKMSGSRLRRMLKELGFIDLIQKSRYVAHVPNHHAFEGWLQSVPKHMVGGTFIPVPNRKKGGLNILWSRCYETVLHSGFVLTGRKKVWNRNRPSSSSLASPSSPLSSHPPSGKSLPTASPVLEHPVRPSGFPGHSRR